VRQSGLLCLPTEIRSTEQPAIPLISSSAQLALARQLAQRAEAQIPALQLLDVGEAKQPRADRGNCRAALLPRETKA